MCAGAAASACARARARARWQAGIGERVQGRRVGVAGLGGVGVASRLRCAGGERGKERRRGRKRKMENRKENGKKEKEKERGRKREKRRDASAPIAASGRAWPTSGRAARDGTTARKKWEGMVGGKEMTER